MSETIQLFTRQVQQVWDEIKNTGIYSVKEEYIREKNDTISDFYLELYRWYTKEAKKRFPIEEGLEFPIWFNLDESSMLQPAEGTVVFRLEVPREYVLLCDYNAWGYRVNYWYVPIDSKDEEAHNHQLKQYKIADEADLTLTDKGRFYPLLKQKIVKSWNRVFDGEITNKTDVVATTWMIKKSWIKEVRNYEE